MDKKAHGSRYWNGLATVAAALPLAVFDTLLGTRTTSRLARRAAARIDGKSPPPAATFFVSYVDTDPLMFDFVTGHFPTGHLGAPSRDAAKGDLSIWADVPPYAADRRNYVPGAGMEMSMITITCIITTSVCTGTYIITLRPDPSTAASWVAATGSAPRTSAPCTKWTRKRRP